MFCMYCIMKYACCHQATSHYLCQSWPRSVSLYGVTLTKWVTSLTSLGINRNDIYDMSFKSSRANCSWLCEAAMSAHRHLMVSPIARFMGPTWSPSGADRTQVGPMLAPWTLLSGITMKASVACYFQCKFAIWLLKSRNLAYMNKNWLCHIKFSLLWQCISHVLASQLNYPIMHCAVYYDIITRLYMNGARHRVDG